MNDQYVRDSSSALLPDLVEALRQPFAPQEVRLRAGKYRQTTDGSSWICFASPLISLSALEARLEQCASGKWHASLPSLMVAGGRLVIVVQIHLHERVYDASSEVPFQQTTLLTEPEHLLVQLPVAFEMAFAKACSQFGLGRYLAHLAREWLPYDPQHGRIALSSEEQYAYVLKLYRQAGLEVPSHPVSAHTPHKRQDNVHTFPARTGKIPEIESAASPAAPMNRDMLRARKIAWVRQQCASHSGSLARILARWHVYNLEALSDAELRQVVVSIEQSPSHTLPRAS